MSLPVLLVVDEDAAALTRAEEQLSRRYGGDYAVRAERSAGAALAILQALREDGVPVALVLADQWTDGMIGAELLTRAKALHPSAKRGLLIEWGGMGRPRHRGGDLRGDGAGPNRLLRAEAGALARRALPPHDRRVPLRVGAGRDLGPGGDRVRRRARLPAHPPPPRPAGAKSVPYVCHRPDSAPGRELLAAADCEDAAVPVARIRDEFICSERGVEEVKGFGEQRIFSLEGELDSR